MPQAWYRVQAAADNSTAEIDIFDAIGATWDGEGVTAKQFIADLRAVKAPQITLSINSPGGSLFDGIAIHTALAMHPATVTARVMGLAASAASVIAMAADRVEMAAGSFMMVHKSASFAWGNADEMRDTADWLDRVDASMGAIYAKRTGKSAEEVAALLADETWMTPDEAIANGFADAVIDAGPVTAKFDLAKLPANVRAAFEKRTLAAAPGAVSLAASVKAEAATRGLPETYAAAIALDPNVRTVEAARAALDEAVEIRDLSALAGKPEMADALVTQRKGLAEARAALIDARADDSDESHVDPAQPANPKPAAKAPAWGPSGFWASRTAA